MKVCSKCKIEKDESEFQKDKAQLSGLSCSCKKCKQEWYFSRYPERKRYNPAEKGLNIQTIEEKRLKSKELQIKNKEKYKLSKIKWREKNRDTLLLKKKEYSKCEKSRHARKEYFEKNKNEIYKKNKIWRENNPEYRRNYESSQRENNIQFKISKLFRSRMRMLLKRDNARKDNSFLKIMGLTFEDYITYFEKNYPVEFAEITVKGKYHIDHIIPCAIYDFNNPEHIKLCWQPENLRIIPAEENLSKSDKLDFELIRKHNIEHLLPEGIKCLN